MRTGANGFFRDKRTPAYSPLSDERVWYPWSTSVYVRIPGSRRQVRLVVPNLARLTSRRGGTVIIILAVATALYTFLSFARRFSTPQKQWQPPSPADLTTLVFERQDLKNVWLWEIASGHYPSRAPVPEQIQLGTSPKNPGLPKPRRLAKTGRNAGTDTVGSGEKRVYLDIQVRPPNVAYPPRPVPGSIADLDVVMEHCDFSTNQYVRDCLEVLRVGAGLDNEVRLRRGKIDDWRYIYVEKTDDDSAPPMTPPPPGSSKPTNYTESDPNAGLQVNPDTAWEPRLKLPPVHPRETPSVAAADSACDKENPRLFHMFWTGPFTDKPYLALLSFLFTQNVGLHEPAAQPTPGVCRPQFWLWINPGPAAALPNPHAEREMFEQLQSNPWAMPFLHERFADVIRFRLWNTTEQLDGVPELRDEWRALRDSLFNSGGHVVPVHAEEAPTAEDPTVTKGEDEDPFKLPPAKAQDTKAAAAEDDMLHRLGSSSSASYDRMSVILSDMARFVLCHRFGGIYLDADTIFLRDWEELMGWRGAFAYRWSRLEKYNTAVMKLNKGSALGSFLFRTAFRNGLDFHPMSVSRYTKDAYLEGLLLRLPDALFDSAWLNTEYYQRDRPPQPYFTEFNDFFETPSQNSAGPQALGFDGFFKGAYSYHFHNFWWKPFDPSRNWPDLGPRFAEGENLARDAVEDAAFDALVTLAPDEFDAALDAEEEKGPTEDDKRDLDWATVLKRTFEAYIRGERPNMYGEWLQW